MANRFTKRIKSGEIDSEEQLKSEFKALAKTLHPDIAGEAFHAEFVRVRQEYESALGDFGHFRFSAGNKGKAYGPDHMKTRKPDLFAELFLLMKRGFPKTVRHEKERLRYQYCIWKFRNATVFLGRDTPSLFDAFHHELLLLKTEDGNAYKKISEILYNLIEHQRKPLSPLRTAIELEYEATRKEGILGVEAQAFLGRLVSELGEGNIVRDR